LAAAARTRRFVDPSVSRLEIEGCRVEFVADQSHSQGGSSHGNPSRGAGEQLVVPGDEWDAQAIGQCNVHGVGATQAKRHGQMRGMIDEIIRQRHPPRAAQAA
jgi:hypothetical protein